MSFTSGQDHLTPNDPLYYAPRSARSEADLRSNSTLQTSPERLTAHPRSRFDKMLEEAVGNSMRHPPEFELVLERDEPPPVFRTASRVAAVIGAFAFVGFVYFIMAPKVLQASPPEPAVPEYRTGASAGAAKITPEESRSLLQKFEQSVASAGALKVTRDESRTLLQKFEQWRQRH